MPPNASDMSPQQLATLSELLRDMKPHLENISSCLTKFSHPQYAEQIGSTITLLQETRTELDQAKDLLGGSTS